MISRISPTQTKTIDGLISGYLPPFPGATADDIHHGNFHDRIDPNLNTMGDVPMQQFLRDPHAPMFSVQSPHQFSIRAVQHDHVSFTPGSQGRHGSPFSQHQPSLASSAQSPRTESDIFYESTQGPSTPPDMKSPFTHVYEPWDGELLTGLSLAPTDGCVKPSDIHPSQVHFDDFNEKSGSREFTLDQGLSFDGSNPSTHYQRVNVAQQPLPRMSSPVNGFQHRPSLDPVYPDPETIDEITVSVEEANIDPKDYATEEQVHNPITARRKPARAAKSPSRRGRQGQPELPTLTRRSKVMKTTNASDRPPTRRLPASIAVNFCHECELHFKDAVALQKHIKAQHRRPFTCVFHFAGCKEAFANKNEWKRHVQAQHLNLHFWLCTHDACGSVMAQDCQFSETPTHGRPFRRKDLFTQHVRRMHPTPSSSRKNKKSKYAAPERDDQLKKMQEDAFRKRCEMPTYMRCPAKGCDREFHGEGTWNDRMEHVARHLERAANNDEPTVRFGGPDDDSLTEWAASEDVNVIYMDAFEDWRLCQPIKNARVNLRTVPSRAPSRAPSPAMDVDQDAEGEECV